MRRTVILLWCWLWSGLAVAFPSPRDYLPDPGFDEPASGGGNADGLYGVLYIFVACLAVALLPKRLWYLKALAIGWPALYFIGAVALTNMR